MGFKNILFRKLRSTLRGNIMKKTITYILFTVLTILLSGCTPIGDKSTSLSVIYAITAIISLLLLIVYCCFIKKREIWFLLLFASVFVVNTGYFTLSISQTLDEALLANRISYLGSAFLPLSMIMTILNVCTLNYKKWFPGVLLVITSVVFLIAASPGYLDIYYKSVTLSISNGVSVLVKEYGPWHCIYLFYLMGYFGIMVASIIQAITKKKIESSTHAVILLIAVFVNIAVWFLEQLVKIDFEFLSVSYIITELFLIGLYLMIENQEKALSKLKAQISIPTTDKKTDTPKPEREETEEFLEHCKFLSDNLHTLTATEKTIYNFYMDGKRTKDIMKELNITENTVKYHNKNLYSKLGVSSRKQLIEYSKAIIK